MSAFLILVCYNVLEKKEKHGFLREKGGSYERKIN